MASKDKRIRVLVVDDSAFMRKAISRILNSDPALEVVDTAVDGKECLEKVAALRPDVVTLDVMMPGLDGLSVLRRLMEEDPVPVVMLSSLTTEGAEISLWALDEGAVDIVDKPATYTNMNMFSIGPRLVRKVKAAASVDLAHLPRRSEERTDPPSVTGQGAAVPHRPLTDLLAAPAHPSLDAVVIGASTGGPPALQRILAHLSAESHHVPIALVQHMPDGFTAALAARLHNVCPVEVKEAEDGDLFVGGRVLIARSGMQMHFERRRAGVVVRLDYTPANTSHMPSIDVTMTSAAETFPGRCLGVLLTGMGSDGAAGMLALARSGAPTIAEAESSAVIFGMPQAAIAAGAVGEVLDLSDICSRFARGLVDANS